MTKLVQLCWPVSTKHFIVSNGYIWPDYLIHITSEIRFRDSFPRWMPIQKAVLPVVVFLTEFSKLGRDRECRQGDPQLYADDTFQQRRWQLTKNGNATVCTCSLDFKLLKPEVDKTFIALLGMVTEGVWNNYVWWYNYVWRLFYVARNKFDAINSWNILNVNLHRKCNDTSRPLGSYKNGNLSLPWKVSVIKTLALPKYWQFFHAQTPVLQIN